LSRLWPFRVGSPVTAIGPARGTLTPKEPGVRFTLIALAFAAALFAGMMVFLEIGRRIGARRMAQDGEGARTGIGVVEGSVFGLLGLLLAFTFSGAAERFDARRNLIAEEVNAIGTAWLRIDIMTPNAQPAMRDAFRRYLDARLASYRQLLDGAATMKERANATQAEGEIWAQAVAASRSGDGQPAQRLLLPSLNAMFDIAEMRTLALLIHPPRVIFVMLALMALASALLAGYGMAPARNWLHMLGFAATIAIAVYVIVDLEYPRFGLIRVDAFDQSLLELRASMQ
jgi:hypothetical protein